MKYHLLTTEQLLEFARDYSPSPQKPPTTLPPSIELPGDEEIEELSDEFTDEIGAGFYKGARWLRDKLLNQENK